MPHYKTPSNALYFLDSPEFEHLLPLGSLEITQEEANSLAPKPTVKDQIAQLEASITPRRMREALMGDISFIEFVEKQIAALRADL